jgi:hypothetical protein
MSAMKMEQNGRASAGQRPRHINIRYFFIKDRIASGEINLFHCPTGIMIADFFTKPLQGYLFENFRDVVMGITHFSTLTVPPSIEPRSVLENDISGVRPRQTKARADSYDTKRNVESPDKQEISGDSNDPKGSHSPVTKSLHVHWSSEDDGTENEPEPRTS